MTTVKLWLRSALYLTDIRVLRSRGSNGQQGRLLMQTSIEGPTPCICLWGMRSHRNQEYGAIGTLVRLLLRIHVHIASVHIWARCYMNASEQLDLCGIPITFAWNLRPFGFQAAAVRPLRWLLPA